MADHVVDVLVDDGIDVDPAPLEHALIAMLAVLPLQEAELSVRLTRDDEIRALNTTWRGKVAATDVLSFPMQEGEEVTGGLLGDIVVSVDTAARQAASLGHDTQTEFFVLLAHGLAHLLGHDHQEARDAREMQALEARFLAAIGLETAGLIGRSLADGTEPDA